MYYLVYAPKCPSLFGSLSDLNSVLLYKGNLVTPFILFLYCSCTVFVLLHRKSRAIQPYSCTVTPDGEERGLEKWGDNVRF